MNAFVMGILGNVNNQSEGYEMAQSGSRESMKRHQDGNVKPIGPKDPGHNMTGHGGPQSHRGGGGGGGMKKGY